MPTPPSACARSRPRPSRLGLSAPRAPPRDPPPREQAAAEKSALERSAGHRRRSPRLRRHRIEDAVWLGHRSACQRATCARRGRQRSVRLFAERIGDFAIARGSLLPVRRRRGCLARPARAFMRDQLVQMLCEDETERPVPVAVHPRPGGRGKAAKGLASKQDPRCLLEHDDLAPDGCELRGGNQAGQAAATMMASASIATSSPRRLAKPYRAAGHKTPGSVRSPPRRAWLALAIGGRTLPFLAAAAAGAPPANFAATTLHYYAQLGKVVGIIMHVSQTGLVAAPPTRIVQLRI